MLQTGLLTTSANNEDQDNSQYIYSNVSLRMDRLPWSRYRLLGSLWPVSNFLLSSFVLIQFRWHWLVASSLGVSWIMDGLIGISWLVFVLIFKKWIWDFCLLFFVNISFITCPHWIKVVTSFNSKFDDYSSWMGRFFISHRCCSWYDFVLTSLKLFTSSQFDHFKNWLNVVRLG